VHRSAPFSLFFSLLLFPSWAQQQTKRCTKVHSYTVEVEHDGLLRKGLGYGLGPEGGAFGEVNFWKRAPR
jgi:hypothetical protein